MLLEELQPYLAGFCPTGDRTDHKPRSKRTWWNYRLIYIARIYTKVGSTHHNTATLTADFKRGIVLDFRKGSKDLSPKRILDEESAVIKCCDNINNWKNLFNDSDNLFSVYPLGMLPVMK